MDRRGFLKALAATVGGVALSEAIPFNRVWSFPKEIVPLNVAPLATIYYDKAALNALKGNLLYYFVDKATGKRLTPNIRMSHYLPDFDHEVFFGDRWPDVEIKLLEGMAEEMKKLPEGERGKNWRMTTSGLWQS